MDVGIRGCGQHAAHGGGCFQNRRGQGRDDGVIVGAVDGHGQSSAACGPVVVDDLIGNGVGEGFPDAEPLHGGQGVVQDVGVVPSAASVSVPYAPARAARGIKATVSWKSGSLGRGRTPEAERAVSSVTEAVAASAAGASLAPLMVMVRVLEAVLHARR